MARTPEKPRRRPGRPTKAEEVARVLAEIGVDPALVDPLRILAGIAANGRMPPVAACNVLLGVKDQEPVEDLAAGSDVAERAIRLMAAARKATH